MTQPYVLVLYFSRYGSTEKLAHLIGRGIESNGKFEAKLRTVPPIARFQEAGGLKYQTQVRFTAHKKI